MVNLKIIIKQKLVPEGDLILENIGPVNVSGLTIKDAKKD